MLNPIDWLKKNLEVSVQAKQQLLADAESLSLFAKAAEFVSRLVRDRAPLPAEALTVDSSLFSPPSATTTASTGCFRDSLTARRQIRTYF